jgi:hypothetical protein
MTVSDLSEQPCNKSDNAIKLVTSCQQLVPTTGNKQCEDNLSTACEQICNNLCTTHVKISQLVNKMSSQQACSKLVNKL